MTKAIELFEIAMCLDVNDIFDQYQNYIMDNADPAEVTICNGDTLLAAADNEYLLKEFRTVWIKENVIGLTA